MGPRDREDEPEKPNPGDPGFEQPDPKQPVPIEDDPRLPQQEREVERDDK
jgi:hypothetical protein